MIPLQKRWKSPFSLRLLQIKLKSKVITNNVTQGFLYLGGVANAAHEHRL